VNKLLIYNQALDLVYKVYKLVKTNKPIRTDYSLCNQLKRASVSVPFNIAEGYFRTHKQFKNYLKIAIGSANEVRTLLIILSRVYRLNTKELQKDYESLGKQISAFIKSF